MTKSTQLTPADYDHTRLFERPDGVYWQENETGREYGPFKTLLEAIQDMQLSEDSAGETLEEAEAEIGIADWIDPDTGEPAEEERARIEDSH